MGFFEDTIEGLKKACKDQFGNAARLAEKLDIPATRLTRWFTGERTPRLDVLGPVLDAVGAKIVFPSGGILDMKDTTKPVQFVEAALLLNGRHNHLPQPTPDKYRAIPVVSGEVAAGEGLLPEDGIDSWMILSTVEPAVRRSSNLLAVRVGRRQRSMLPLIHPGATVLVDCDDRQPTGESSIYLVRDPHDGRALKKVMVFTRHGEEFVTFYSLNAEEFPPFTYSVEKDFDGNLRHAIVGKVVWLWQDLTGV